MTFRTREIWNMLDELLIQRRVDALIGLLVEHYFEGTHDDAKFVTILGDLGQSYPQLKTKWLADIETKTEEFRSVMSVRAERIFELVNPPMRKTRNPFGNIISMADGCDIYHLLKRFLTSVPSDEAAFDTVNAFIRKHGASDQAWNTTLSSMVKGIKEDANKDIDDRQMNLVNVIA